MLRKIGIFENFGPKLKLFENYDRHQDFNFFLPKWRFSEKFTQNLVFPKIFTKIGIFENFDQNRDVQNCSPKCVFFFLILTKIKIFEYLGKHRFFFSKILIKV